MDSNICSYCGSGGRLVHGPGMAICADCVKRLQQTDEKEGNECAFCGQTSQEVQRLHKSKSSGRSVCGFCIENFADTL